MGNIGLKKLVALVLVPMLFISLLYAKKQDLNSIEENNTYITQFVNKKLDLDKTIKQLGFDHFLLHLDFIKIKEVYQLSKTKTSNLVVFKGSYKRNGKEMPFSTIVDINTGNVFTGVILDRNKKPLVLKSDLSPNKNKAAFKLGSGDKDIYVFIDPDCPPCIGFEKKLRAGFKDKEYTLYFYFFPLKNLHPNAYKKSAYLLSLEKDKRFEMLGKIAGVNNFTNKKLWEDNKYIKKYSGELNNMVRYGQNYVGVTGTPFVVNQNGFQIQIQKIFK